MSAVGLFYVGAVLFINGLMLLGRVSARSAGIFNILVGGLQCVMPLMILAQSGGDAATLHATFPTLSFGFTYLYVGIANLAGISGEGIGWFSLFVAASTIYAAIDSFFAEDLTFGVIWLAWGILWLLFFALLALEKSTLTPFAGWLVTLWALPTTSIPAVLLLRDAWVPGAAGAAGLLVLLGVLAITATVLARRTLAAAETSNAPENELAGQSV
ncbi:AmiS/UreI family transporter [Pseudarthrobacter sp. ATCC 49987]|uniref:AmiS/UreI family transporter n=1 Tax=Pseudarthrobacter sp. ATCC 49987 TaxID=2698204 RepID=UPI00136C07D6|nr:AmiS/UreI family transporter [Pseudarthrobacter sp. ATCC 49987]